MIYEVCEIELEIYIYSKFVGGIYRINIKKKCLRVGTGEGGGGGRITKLHSKRYGCI